ncbi:MAG: nitroreductase family protein, partial [Candidatus Nanoarchaeia archaeon]
MDILTCISTRRSIRNFKSDKIPEEILYEILNAANSAPCAGGLQNWRFLIIEDEAKKKEIAKAALNQDWLASAPTIILICSEVQLLEQEYGKRGAEIFDYQNAALAAENLILAAWNFGIGSTFVGSFTEFRLRRLLKIPDSVRIHAIIPLGYPAEKPKFLKKLGIEDLTYFEEWKSFISKRKETIAGILFPDRPTSTKVRIG